MLRLKVRVFKSQVVAPPPPLSYPNLRHPEDSASILLVWSLNVEFGECRSQATLLSLTNVSRMCHQIYGIMFCSLWLSPKVSPSLGALSISAVFWPDALVRKKGTACKQSDILPDLWWCSCIITTSAPWHNLGLAIFVSGGVRIEASAWMSDIYNPATPKQERSGFKR